MCVGILGCILVIAVFERSQRSAALPVHFLYVKATRREFSRFASYVSYNNIHVRLHHCHMHILCCETRWGESRSLIMDLYEVRSSAVQI